MTMETKMTIVNTIHDTSYLEVNNSSITYLGRLICKPKHTILNSNPNPNVEFPRNQ